MTITSQPIPSNDQPARVDTFEAQGINPYPHSFERSCALIDVHQDYGYAGSDGEETYLRLMGRVAAIRPVGRNVYIHLEDRDSRLQFFLSVTHMTPYDVQQFTQLVEHGDWVGFVADRLYRTSESELTARVQHWTILAPVIETLAPDRVAESAPRASGVLRLAGDRQARRRFVTRSHTLRALRRALEDEYGYLEVKTPPLQAGLTSGDPSALASQEGFCSHRESQAYLADLLIGGLDAVYDIVVAPSNTAEPSDSMGQFQANGPSQTSELSDALKPRLPSSEADHILQCGLAPADINDMLSLTERLVADVADVVRGMAVAATVTDHGAPFDSMALRLGLNWRRRSLIAMVQVETGHDFLYVQSLEQAVEIAGRVGVDVQDCHTIGEVAVRIATQLVYPQLREPTFLVDYPHTEFPRAKPDRHSFSLAEMARLFLNGACFGMAYTVQNDPRRAGLGGVAPMDFGLLPASEMSYGLPPAGMLCIHVDRLLGVLMGSDDSGRSSTST